MTRPTKGYRSSDHGSYMIDRNIRGVGRIHMASGLTNAAQFRVLNDGITELATTPAGIDVLRAMLARTVTPLAVFQAVRAKDLSMLAIGPTGRPLLTAVRQWREDEKGSVAKRTYEVRKELVTHLARVVTETTPITALPDALRQLKRDVPARSFNLDLAYASAFARDTFGKRSALYLDVRDIEPKKGSVATERRPLTPDEVLTLSAAFDRIWKGRQGSRGDEVLAMALTGMGPTEYWGQWSVRAHHVHIDGTKRASRVRDIPKLFPCALYDHETIPKPSITPTSFARALRIARVATGIDCTPYDLRRTFGNWLEQAGVLRSRRKQYLGHAVGDVTERYERHDVGRFLVEDAETVRTWIAANLRQRETAPKTEPSPSLTPSERFSDREVPLSDLPTR
jgi:integrase